MADPLSDGRHFSIIDGLRENDVMQTEAVGPVRLGKSGVATTSNLDLVQEFKAKRPWAQIVEHEPQTGGRATRRQWTIPNDDWKTRPSIVEAARSKEALPARGKEQS